MIITAHPQMAVTMYPVVVNLLKTLSILVPVLLKKVLKTEISAMIVIAVNNMTMRESTPRSVTTVPIALEKETLSFFLRTPQRANSPILGIIRLTA
jgi:hypothetical protein